MSVLHQRPVSEREWNFLGFLRYTLAMISVFATAGVQLALNGNSITTPLIVSLLGVFVVAYFAGRGPALCATCANFLANWYFFSEPRYSFNISDRADALRLALFFAVAVSVSLMSHKLSEKRHIPIVALMLISSLLLMIAASLVWLDFERERDAEGWVEHTYQVLTASRELQGTIEDAESNQRNYLLTGQEQYLALFRAAAQSESIARQKLGQLVADNPAQQARLTELGELTRSRMAALDRTAALRREQNMEAAIEAVRGGGGSISMDRIRSVLNLVNAEEHRLLNQRGQLAATQAARTRWALAMGPALLVVLLILAGLVIERDVSKIKASERMLRRQADLLDNTPGPIIVWELGGAIEYWNRGAEQLYGISRQQAVGRSHNDLLQPMNPLGMTVIQDLLARDGEWAGELRHVIKGREIIVESHMALVTEQDGRKIVLKTNRDITREKHALEEVQELNRELEQRVMDRTAQLEVSNKELEAFAYSVSHDLRAPLRGIDGWSRALLEDYAPALDQTAQKYLASVREETRRMDQLIDALLKLSRLTRVELQRERVDLSLLARNIVWRLRQGEPSRSVEFVIQDGLNATGDGRLLEIALSNLLGNAMKFTVRQAAARIEFGRTRWKDGLAFYVRDNGVGFDMAYAELLYGAFQRLHRQSEFPGTGIGLATVQRVLRRHGGNIWADAKPNEGATFYFTIGSEFSERAEIAAEPGARRIARNVG